MKYLFFSDNEKTKYRIAILVNKIRKDEITKEYITPFNLPKDDVIVIDFHQSPGKKKTPAAEQKRYITEELQPVLDDLGVEYVFVADAEYFKTFSKAAKADANIGYVLDSAYGAQKIGYLPNYASVFYDPDKVRAKIAQAMIAMQSHMVGSYIDPGKTIIKYADYPTTVFAIKEWLLKLYDMPALTCDIEAFSLKHFDAGIGTITFCWNQEEGVAFPVDFLNPNDARLVRAMLKDFFEHYQGTLIYHSISYDVYVLIYQLFMEHILDQEGLLYGLEVMLRNWHDTKLITYLATNSCAGNRLSLKEQAQEFAGNYAQEEIKDIRKIPLSELLQYNLVDGLSTWYVFNKHYQTMVDDNQLEIYNTIFKPAIMDIIQMQLTGLPVDMERVKEVRPILQADSDNAVARMLKLPVIQQFEYMRLEAHTEKKNNEWVNKRMTVAEMAAQAQTHEPTRKETTFNPNSGPQLIQLLYGPDFLGLPVIAVTDTKQAATDADTLKALKNHTSDPDVIAFLDALVDYKAVDKILTTVIPALEGAIEGPDGWHYLFGNFNLGGTLSGRLSSSEPNLQNLPATGTRYAKIIKSCFKAPPEWFFCGIDFNSLEDRISALTTKDPNKLKVYTDGYDGHSLRAFAYFGDQMTGIIDGNVASINSIQTLYKGLRQESKAPTFALTYQGTYRTLMTNCGFPEAKARMVEEKYHALYEVSDQWVNQKLDDAMRDGYITAAFGLRLRTPLLKQVIRGTRKTPHEAEAEGRTAGNALGQSWCLLNSRAGSEFMGKVRKSAFRLTIKPCAQIHDAQYFLIKDDIDAIMYANDNVVQACQWQNHPDIAHPDVKLGGTFSIFYPTWDKEFDIPNNASADQIYQAVQEHMDKLAA